MNKSSLLATLVSVIALNLFVQPAIGNESRVREVRDSEKQMVHLYDKKTHRRIASYFDDPAKKGKVAKVYVRDASNALTKILHADRSYTLVEYSPTHSDVTLRKSNGDVINIKINKKQKTLSPVSMFRSGKFDLTFQKSQMLGPKLLKVIASDDDEYPPTESDIEDMYWEDYVIEFEVEIDYLSAGPACYGSCNSALTSAQNFCNATPPPFRQECLSLAFVVYGYCMLGCLLY